MTKRIFTWNWIPHLLVTLLAGPVVCHAQTPTSIARLTDTGDIASSMIDGIDRFLLKQLQNAENEIRSLEPVSEQRQRLAKILGVVDEERPSQLTFEIVHFDSASSAIQSKGCNIQVVRWDAIANPSPQFASLTSVHGEGLLLTPTRTATATIITIPDVGVSPEQFVGLNSAENNSSLPLKLAQAGYRVVVPTLINRDIHARNGRAKLTNREYLHRPAYELGRHLIGMEVQKILAAVDYWHAQGGPIAVYGKGDAGMIALYAGALDERIHHTTVVGYLGPRHQCWNEPLDRNVFSRLKHFPDAELARLVAPRSLLIGTFGYPELTLTGQGGAPSLLETPEQASIQHVVEEASAFFEPQNFSTATSNKDVLKALVNTLGGESSEVESDLPNPSLPAEYRSYVELRQQRQIQELDRHIQSLLSESRFVRKDFFNALKTDSILSYEKTIEQYREFFRKEVIGSFDEPLSAPNARTRQSWETDAWRGYEVKLDVFPDVFAYGVLLLPKDLGPNEKRPVVVCQHGLEGRPTDTFENDHRAYHDFAGKLCERGFIVFCPQNPYIFKDRFRSLQRKANPLGKTLFSIIVPQHQQIVNWLKKQSFVDADRIAFYGLSYGGKSAMRIPALVTDYCLSICSADFNEWVRKNASTRDDFSYVWTGEYEIFEWNLGRTFNYFEMAALICPRPFMVERGHFDGVGTDEWVAFEYAKVRNLYAAKLKIPERTQIEWFDGPHTINGQGTFDFLHHHLQWPSTR